MDKDEKLKSISFQCTFKEDRAKLDGNQFLCLFLEDVAGDTGLHLGFWFPLVETNFDNPLRTCMKGTALSAKKLRFIVCY